MTPEERQRLLHRGQNILGADVNSSAPLTVSYSDGRTDELVSNTLKQAGVVGNTEAFSINKDLYDKYAKYGIIPNAAASQEDLDRERAEKQSIISQFGNMLGQAVVNEVLLGTIRGFSDIFDAVYSIAKNDDNDYTNAVSTQIEDWQNYIRDEVLPIYQRENDGGFHINDFGWWMNGAVSTATTLSLMLPGLGISKGVSLLGKVGNVGSKVGKLGYKITKAGAKLVGAEAKAGQVFETLKGGLEVGGMAFMSRTAENYQEARETYNTVLEKTKDRLSSMKDEEREKFLKINPEFADLSDDEIAEAIASSSAGKTFLNDYWMLLMDIPQFKTLSSIWKGAGIANKATTRGIRKANAEAINRLVGKGLSEEAATEVSKTFAQRLGSAFSIENLGKVAKNVWTGTEGLMLGEGIEEGFQGIQSQRGEEYGELYFNPYLQRKTLGQYLNDETIWEQAFWGVMGGLLFQGGAKTFRRLEDKARAKIKSKDLSEIDIKALQLGEDKSRVAEIYGRFDKMDDYKEKMGLINNGKNPYSVKKDSKGQDVLVDGKRQYDDIQSTEEVEQLKTLATKDFLTNLVISAANNGNYDLLKEFVSNKEFAQYFKDSGVNTDELLENQLISKMDDIYNKYQTAYYETIDNTDAYNEHITRLVASEIARDELTLEEVQDRIDDLNAQIADRELSNQSHYEQIAKQRVIHQKLDAIDAAINKINEKKNDRNTFYSKQAFDKEYKDLQRQKDYLYRELERTNSNFNYSGVLSESLEDTLQAASELYNSFVLDNTDTTAFENLSQTTQRNLYSKAAYELFRDELQRDLPNSDNLKQYYTDKYDEKLAMFIDIANSKFAHAYDKVYNYIKRSDNPYEAIQHLLKDEIVAEDGYSAREISQLNDALDVLRFGSQDREAFNNALMFMVVGEQGKRRREQQESEEVKVEDEKVNPAVAEKVTGIKPEEAPSPSTGQQGVNPESPVREDGTTERLDDTGLSLFDEEGELPQRITEEEKKIIDDFQQERLLTNGDDIPFITSYNAVEEIIKTHRTLWQNTVKDGVGSKAYTEFIELVKDYMIINLNNSKAVADKYAELGLRLFVDRISNAGKNASTPQGKKLKEFFNAITEALGFDSNTGDSRYEGLSEEEAQSKKDESIRNVFEQFIKYSGVKHSIVDGRKVIDVADLFLEMSKTFDDNNRDYISILYLYNDISNFINGYRGTEYLFLNRGLLSLKHEEFIDALNKKRTEVKTVSPFMHFSSTLNSNTNSSMQGLNTATKIKILQQARDKGVTLSITRTSKGDPVSIAFNVKYNGKTYELGMLSLVEGSKDNNTLTSKYQGLEISLTKNNDGSISSSEDYLFDGILNNSELYNYIASWFSTEKAHLFNGNTSQSALLALQKIQFNSKLDILSNPTIKRYIDEHDLENQYKKSNSKKSFKDYVLGKITDVVFYDMYSKDTTPGAVDSKLSNLITKFGIRESIERFKEKQYDNFSQTKALYDKLEAGEEVNAVYKSDDVGSIRYDRTRTKSTNRLGIANETEQHPIIYYDGSKGIDENGKIYANIPGLSIGTIGIVMGENQGEYYINENGEKVNSPGANLALITGGNKILSNNNKLNRELYDALKGEMNSIINDYYDVIQNNTATLAQKNAAYERLYNRLNDLFGNSENKLFSNFIVGKGKDVIGISTYIDGQYVPVLKVFKYKSLTFDNGVRRRNGRIVEGEELNQYFGGGFAITVPGGTHYNQFSNKSEAQQKRIGELIDYIADNVEFNTTRFAVTNANNQNTQTSHIKKVDGKIEIEVGSFKHQFDNFAQAVVRLNMFNTSQIGTSNRRYDYVDKYGNPKLPKSFFLQINDTVAPISEQEKVDQLGLKGWIDRNNIEENEEVVFEDILYASGFNSDVVESIKDFNDFLEKNSYPLFIKPIVLLNGNLSREENGVTYEPFGRYDGKNILLGRKAATLKQKESILRILVHENIHRVVDETKFFDGEVGQNRINEINDIFDIFYDELSRDKTSDRNVKRLKEKFKQFNSDYKDKAVIANEFMAEVMSDAGLRNYMNTIEVETEQNKGQSLLQRIFDFIAKLFGIDVKDNTLLSQFRNALRDIDTSASTESIKEQPENPNSPVEGDAQSGDDTDFRDMTNEIGLEDIEFDSRYEGLTSEEIVMESLDEDKTDNIFGVNMANDMQTYLQQLPSSQRSEMVSAIESNELNYLCR